MLKSSETCRSFLLPWARGFQRNSCVLYLKLLLSTLFLLTQRIWSIDYISSVVFEFCGYILFYYMGTWYWNIFRSCHRLKCKVSHMKNHEARSACSLRHSCVTRLPRLCWACTTLVSQRVSEAIQGWSITKGFSIPTWICLINVQTFLNSINTP